MLQTLPIKTGLTFRNKTSGPLSKIFKTQHCKSMNFTFRGKRSLRLPAHRSQIWLAMKLTVVLLTVALLQVSAKGTAQKITFSGTNVPLQQVFSAIKKQTGYVFFYRNDDLSKSKPVTVRLKEASLETALQNIFKEQPLYYSVKENTVVISSRQTLGKEVKNADELTEAKPPIDVRGKIINEKGEPVVATVSVKGTSTATSTNESGAFELRGISDNAILVIEGVNIQTREVNVGGQRNITISVRTKFTEADEVIVSTGYQTLKKGQLTGAYSTINRETYLQTVPTTGSIVENMEGRIPGLMLNINQSRNNFNNANNTSPFTIRGVSTFQAIKKPLIVLNGYPTEIDIEAINPYDIETITVLKDAASAAIYGVRASNGVIVIVTKKGSIGKPVINFTTAITYKPKPDYGKLNLLSGTGFTNFESAVGINDIENNFVSKDYLDMSNGTYTPVFSITDDLYNGKITQAEADKLYADLAAYDNTKDYKKLFLQNPLLQTYDVNVSGGGGAATYFFGVNHVNNSGSQKKSSYSKTNINYRGSFDLSDRIGIDIQSIYSNSNNKSVPTPDYLSMRPYQRFLDADGNALPTYFAKPSYDFFGYGDSYGTLSGAQNQSNIDMGLYDAMYYPYQEMFENSNKLKSDVFRVQANLKAKIIAGLNFEAGGVFEREVDKMDDIASENAYATRIMLNYYASPDPFTGNPVFGIPKGGIKKSFFNSINSYTLRAQLTYNKLLGGLHDVSLLGGAEQRQITNEGSINTVFGYNGRTLAVQKADLTLLGSQNYYPGFADIIVPYSGFGVYDQTGFGAPYFNESYTDDRFVSYYANAAYTYNRKYTLSGSMRIDQSNLFGTDPKFRYTPLWSAGLAWNIANENFLHTSSWINELKLRVAAGYNGNIIKNSGPFNILSNSVNTYLPNPTVGYSIRSPRNNRLRWEKTFNFNTGVDFSVFDGRFSGSVDYYIKRGEDIFSPIQIDPTSGFSNLSSNNASIENRGVDLMLSSYNVKTKNFSWQTAVTASFNKSKVLDLNNKWNGFYMFTRAGGAENIEGHPLGSVLTLDYVGLNEKGQPLIRNEKGELVEVGFNKPDIAFEALKFAGVNDPKYAIGFNNQFAVGSFSLSALLMYYGGHVGLVAPPSVYDSRPVKELTNYWQKPGDEKTTDIPGFGVYSLSGYRNGQKFVRDFDFIALRDVTLTYHLKNNLAQRIGLNNTKLILQVQNGAKHVFSGNDIDSETFEFVSGRRGLPTVPAFTFSLSTNF